MPHPEPPPSAPVPPKPRTSCPRAAWLIPAIAWWALWLGTVGLVHAEGVRGLPFIRAYSLEEIGKVPRGVRLGFDSYGRFAVMYDGVYAVLNDTTWVDRIDANPANRTLMTTLRVVDGTYFYGGRASWGIAEQTQEGNLRAHPLVPNDAPAWTKVTAFNDILPTRSGVFFHELNGVVYWDYARRQNQFFELPRVAACFRVGDRIFVSCQDRQLREIHPDTGQIETISIPGLEGSIVERAIRLGETAALLALQDGRLLVVDGVRASPWAPQVHHDLHGRIAGMCRLVEGGVAVTIAGKGLYVVAGDGTLRWHLPPAHLPAVGAVASNEPGVLWAMGENSVYRIVYDSALTSFGQSLGLNVVWPRILLWNGRRLVVSGRSLFEFASSGPGAPSRARPFGNIPEGRVAALATRGEHLLVADGNALFAVGADGAMDVIGRQENIARIEFVASDVCIAIGSREIAAFRHRAGRWAECATRIEGVGDAPIVTTVREAIWVEMGADNVARLLWRDDTLTLERIELPWKGGQWTNIGAIGSTVVFSGSAGNRAYYDEKQGSLVAAPALDALLARSPHWIARVTEDEQGVLWATHTRGVVTFVPEAGSYRVDATTYELRNDSYPVVTVLPGNDVWLHSGRSLYHVEPRPPTPRRTPRPLLVSMFADQRNRELLGAPVEPERRFRFSYDDNSLSFRFFSGTYAWRFPPLYRYRLGDAEPRTALDPSMVLRFPKLRDGDYQLEIREESARDAAAAPFRLRFVVDPPWYRRPLSYAGYAGLLLLAVMGSARWLNQRSLKRNQELEALVLKRTRELEATMEKLNEETRHAATLAERSRLAGEIHDSLQQGLSGTLLHLETTLNHAALTPELRGQLRVMRNMLSYSREEVQHAVWNLESPLLQNSTLDQALGKLAGYINAGPVVINLAMPTCPVSLPAEVQHHLLRIAQEAITNAVKHAHARRVDVTLQVDQGAVKLTVRDDGCGFDLPSSRQIEGHFGLRGLETRARSIHAELRIASTPGAGTTIQVFVPAFAAKP